MNILVVDDNLINRKLLRVIFQVEKYAVIEAEDGLEALNRLNKHDISLIISDILMPNLDGYNFCERVKTNQKYRKIPFIFYSSTYTSPADEQLAKDLGADLFLTRPTPTDTILRHVNELLSVVPDPKPITPSDQTNILKQYNQILVNKLEEKNEELATQLDKIKESETKFRMVVENINEVFFILGPNGTPVYYISPVYENMWGKSVQSLYDDPFSWQESVISKDKYKIAELFDDYSESKSIEYRILHPDNTIKWIRTRVFPVLTEGDQVNRLVGFAEDITSYKRLQNQYLQSQKMETLGRLAGGIAHDFNNILMIIQACSELIEKQIPDNDPILDKVKQIKQATSSGADLTGQLLALGKKQQINPEIIYVHELLRDMQGMLERIIPESISLEFTMENNIYPILVDSGQLQQVILNLVINAKDAIGENGDIIITGENVPLDDTPAQYRANQDNEHFIKITVTDTGSGINDKIKDQIFEPFFTTKSEQGGTGLGLSVVFNIVTQNNGYINVQSHESIGTLFELYFPKVADGKLVAVEDAIQLPVELKGDERIILVEDNRGVRLAVDQILSNHGYEVIQASNGKDAFDIYQLHEVDLIVTDTIMPIMNGLELFNKIQQINPLMRFIFISGYNETQLSQETLQSQRIKYVEKPFTSISLLQAVRELLDQK